MFGLEKYELYTQVRTYLGVEYLQNIFEANITKITVNNLLNYIMF